MVQLPKRDITQGFETKRRTRFRYQKLNPNDP